MYHLYTEFVSPSGLFPFTEGYGEGPIQTRGTQTYIHGASYKCDAETQTDFLTSPHQPLPDLAFSSNVLLVDKPGIEGSTSGVFSSHIRSFAIQDGTKQEDIYLVNVRHQRRYLKFLKWARRYSMVIRNTDNIVILKMLTQRLGLRMAIVDNDDKVIAEVSRHFMPASYRVRSAIGLHLFTFRRDGPDAYKVLTPDELVLGDVRREQKLQGGGPPDKFFHPKLFVDFTNICDMRLRALIVCTSFYVVVCEKRRWS